MGNSKEGHVFDIGIMLGSIGNNMMDIVILFPPADRQAANEVRNYDADDAIDMKMVCNAYVTGIMGSKDKLMPQATERDRTWDIPTPPQK